jgi:hypothetical protein
MQSIRIPTSLHPARHQENYVGAIPRDIYVGGSIKTKVTARDEKLDFQSFHSLDSGIDSKLQRATISRHEAMPRAAQSSGTLHHSSSAIKFVYNAKNK